MSKIRTMLIVLLACIALIAVACGDDDAGDDATTTSADDAEGGTSEDGGDDEGTSDDEDGDDEDSDDAGDDDEAAAVDGDAFFDLCDGDFNQDDFAGLGAGAFASIDPTNPDLEASMKATVAQFDEIAEAAPSEIQDDFQVMADAFAKYDEVMESIDYDFVAMATDPSAAAKMAELETAFDSEELATASANITAWTAENCTGLS